MAETWILKKKVNLFPETAINEDVGEFRCGGETFSNIFVEGGELKYDGNNVATQAREEAELVWIDEKYRNLVFTETAVDTQGWLKANGIKSTELENRMKVHILLRNDTAANWTKENPVLKKGEVGVELDTNKFKFGDGSKKWSELDYAGTQVKVEGSGDVITGAEVNAAGELVLTKGNLLDSNVLMSDDFTFTAPVGTVTIPSSGSTIVSAKDKTLKEFLSGLFAAAKDPTVTQPSVSIKLNQAGAYEVGSEVTPTYSVTFNAGSYQYGPATGVTATYSVTDGVTGHEAQAGATGSFAKLTIGDSTSYGVSVIATHTAGASAKNNLGALVGSKINAGTKTASSSKVTGYRNSFYGGVKSKEGTPTNAVIRALSGKSGKTNTAGNTFDAQENVGDLRVIIAVPAPRTCTSIKDVNGLNAEALSAFTHVTVNVEGANAYEAKSYNVYYKDNATACDKANKWHVTLG